MQCFSFTSYIGDMHYNLFKNEERKKSKRNSKFGAVLLFIGILNVQKLKVIVIGIFFLNTYILSVPNFIYFKKIK